MFKYYKAFSKPLVLREPFLNQSIGWITPEQLACRLYRMAGMIYSLYT